MASPRNSTLYYKEQLRNQRKPRRFWKDLSLMKVLFRSKEETTGGKGESSDTKGESSGTKAESSDAKGESTDSTLLPLRPTIEEVCLASTIAENLELIPSSPDLSLIHLKAGQTTPKKCSSKIGTKMLIAKAMNSSRNSNSRPQRPLCLTHAKMELLSIFSNLAETITCGILSKGPLAAF